MEVVVVGVVGCGARGRTERFDVARRTGAAAFVAAAADDMLRVVAFLTVFVVSVDAFAFVALLRVAAVLVPRAATFFPVAVDETFFTADRLATVRREEVFVAVAFFTAAFFRVDLVAEVADFDAFALVRFVAVLASEAALLALIFFCDAFFDRTAGVEAFPAAFLAGEAAFARDDFFGFDFFDAIVSSRMVWRMPANILAHASLWSLTAKLADVAAMLLPARSAPLLILLEGSKHVWNVWIFCLRSTDEDQA
ncbi:hypothetical protein HRbin20_01340 [bacterium HR20]|nr:hypothetical protein HRbin20_01340 [bacterium HR20]